MVAYSFKSRFVEAIRGGVKQQTIRAERKRHARVGEALQLYSAQRTRQCQLIGHAICASVQSIRLDLVNGAVGTGEGALLYSAPEELDLFAWTDGFEDWAALVTFWGKEHPGVSIFSGVMITWRDLVLA